MAGKNRTPGGPGDYDVGYGRPPVATRFVKGVSGNPGGRKKPRAPVNAELQRADPLQHILLDIMAEKVEFEVSPGRRRRVPRSEALVREFVKRASFDPRSFKQLVDMHTLALSQTTQERVAQENTEADTAKLTVELARLMRFQRLALGEASAAVANSLERPTATSEADCDCGVKGGGGMEDAGAAFCVANQSDAGEDGNSDEDSCRERLAEPVAHLSPKDGAPGVVSGAAKAGAGAPAGSHPAGTALRG